MKKIMIAVCATLSIVSVNASAQWGSMSPFGGSGSNMMPFGSSGSSMPWSGQGYSQPQYAQPSFGGMMPWGQNQAPRYQAPQSTPFGGMMPWGNNSQQYQAPASNGFSNMMPWGGGSQQYRAPQSNGFSNMMPFGGMSQQQYRQPQSSFMMPGMDQGIRSMMQPGRVMAEEATPGMYMKPTWR